MTQQGFTESIVEEAALEWLEALGYSIAHGPEIGCGQPGAERADWGQVVLELRLRQALARLNPQVPASALEEAFRKLTSSFKVSEGAPAGQVGKMRAESHGAGGPRPRLSADWSALKLSQQKPRGCPPRRRKRPLRTLKLLVSDRRKKPSGR